MIRFIKTILYIFIDDTLESKLEDTCCPSSAHWSKMEEVSPVSGIHQEGWACPVIKEIQMPISEQFLS